MKNLNQLFLTSLLFILHISSTFCQVNAERLRTLPVEINDAKLIGSDLYVSSSNGIYYTSIDNIDFQILSTASTSNLSAIGDRIFFDSYQTVNNYPLNYCSGDAIIATTTSVTASASKEDIATHSIHIFRKYGLSLTNAYSRPSTVVNDSVIYSQLYETAGQPTNPNPLLNIIGQPVALSNTGTRIGTVSRQFQDFAADNAFYYGVYFGDLYRSDSPLFDNFEVLPSDSLPFEFSFIDHINGQLICDDFHISDDNGESWYKEDYPHNDLNFDSYEDGKYFFTNDSRKLKVSSDSLLSTDYDTLYNLVDHPFLMDRSFYPLDATTFLASTKGSLYISYDKGVAWEDIYAGFWHSEIARPTVTESSRFFFNNEGLFTTTSEGLNYKKIEPMLFSKSGELLPELEVSALIGHHDVLISEINNDGNTNRLFISKDQGLEFHEVFSQPIEKLYRGTEALFAETENGTFSSYDDGVNWEELLLPNTLTSEHRILSIQQNSNIVLLEVYDSENMVFVSYDNGIQFSMINFPDQENYTVSIIDDALIAINYKGKTITRTELSSSWLVTNEQPEYFKTQNPISTSKIFSIGDFIFSLFSKGGYFPDLCQSTSIRDLHYSADFGKTWNKTTLINGYSFTHNEDYYVYNKGLFKYGHDANSEEVLVPDFFAHVVSDNLQDQMTLGDTIEVNLKLENLSPTELLDPYKISVSLFQSDTDQYFTDTITLEDISSKENSEYNFSLPIDKSFSVGQHFIQFKMDPNNSVAEEDENNNEILLDFNLVPFDTTSIYEVVVLCFGEEYYGQTIVENTIIDTIFESIALAELATIEINVIPAAMHTLDFFFCQGSNFLYDDVEYNLPGTYLVDSLQSIQGCDSLLYIHLEELESQIDTMQLDIVAGEYFDSIQIYQDTIIYQSNIDINGCDSTTINVINVNTVFTSNVNTNESFEVYPNPTSDFLNIHSIENSKLEKIELFDIQGRLVLSRDYNQIEDIRLDLSGLPGGIYILYCRELHQQNTFKIFKE